VSNLVGKIVYKPVGILLGTGAGIIAGAVFKQIWKRVGHDDNAPAATDEDRGWGEVLAAAALQAATFGLTTAGVDRAGATGARKVTGEWPT
jgi:hypothetical protein